MFSTVSISDPLIVKLAKAEQLKPSIELVQDYLPLHLSVLPLPTPEQRPWPTSSEPAPMHQETI